MPAGFNDPRICLPGVLAIKSPRYSRDSNGVDKSIEVFCKSFTSDHALNKFPLLVIVDDSEFAARSLNNFLWVTFTRSNPAADIYGVDAFIHQKHWGCKGALLIDARIKPHHAPPLVEDPQVSKRVDRFAGPGGPLHGIL